MKPTAHAEDAGAVHLNFDGNRDLLLDLLCGTSRPLRNNLHPSVGDIWIGFDGQVVERDDSQIKRRIAILKTTNRLFSAKSTMARIIAAPPSSGIQVHWQRLAGPALVRKGSPARSREACHRLRLLFVETDRPSPARTPNPDREGARSRWPGQRLVFCFSRPWKVALTNSRSLNVRRPAPENDDPRVAED
jgi:hypothetical protein